MTTLKQKIIHHSTQKLAAIAGITLLAINTPTVIHAQTHVFPDLSKYTPVDPQPYTGHIIYGDVIYFRTPNQLSCEIDPNIKSTNCQGLAIPDFPTHFHRTGETVPRPGDVNCELVGIVTAKDGTPEFTKGYNSSCSSPGDKPLPVNHKITVDNRTCAVGPHDLTACTDGKHGFVLQPGNTWVF